MHLKLSKGHDFKLSNYPLDEIAEFKSPKEIVINPSDFPYIKPKLLIKDGTEVKVGTPVFLDKLNPDIKFVSPVSGEIKEIIYGERRVVEKIIISNDNNYSELEIIPENEVILNRKSWIDYLKESGLWPLIRQRPFSKIADPESTPKSIFISLHDTRPYGCNTELAISSNKDLFNKGLKLLSKISNCPINISVGLGFDLELISIGNQRSCNIHTIEGPHPSGNVGVQIHHIDPIVSKDDIRWYVDVNSLIDLGYFFENKTYNPYKIISVCGIISNSIHRKVVKHQLIENLFFDEEMDSKKQRIISGDMLSGTEKLFADGIGPYDDMVTVLSVDKEREFLGWINLGINKYSLSNTFFSKLFNSLSLDVNSRLNGDRRSIISFGRWEKMLPMDIMPEALIKSILIEDIESMENLGIYECAEEDFALCAYACQSKIEVSQIIKKGIELAALDD